MSWWLIKQVELYAKFSMEPKADMVPKECGFSQSETASCLCVRISWRFPCSPSMAKYGELIQTQYFCHVEAQWLSGRMPDSRSRERRHESPTHWRRWWRLVVALLRHDKTKSLYLYFAINRDLLFIFYLSRRHNLPLKLKLRTTKLYETSACGCNNNTIFQYKSYFHVSYRWRV